MLPSEKHLTGGENMKETNLVDIYEQLKPAQRQFICIVMKEWGNRPDIHLGTLPFLSAGEAYRVLSIQIESMKEVGAAAASLNLDDRSAALKVRFAQNILSLIRPLVPYKVYPDEASVDLILCDKELRLNFGRRYGKEFNTTMGKIFCNPDAVVHLEMLSKNNWRVTTKKSKLEDATIWLVDNFR
jgi:hypothetical protein